MNNIKKILCPIDFSDYSEAALDCAVQLAICNNNASVHLLHALPQLNYYDWTMTGMYNLISEDTFTQVREDTMKSLESLIKELKAKHPLLEITFKIDDINKPSDAILLEAEDKKADLIVIGSHGRKGFNRLLMGSVAESVMRNAHCNVVVYKKSTTGS